MAFCVQTADVANGDCICGKPVDAVDTFIVRIPNMHTQFHFLCVDYIFISINATIACAMRTRTYTMADQ